MAADLFDRPLQSAAALFEISCGQAGDNEHGLEFSLACLESLILPGALENPQGFADGTANGTIPSLNPLPEHHLAFTG